MRKILYIFGGLLLLGLTLIGYSVLNPAQYEVEPFVPRQGTMYWALRPENRIGYTKIKAATAAKKEPLIYLHGGPGGTITDDLIEVLTPLREAGHDLYFYDQRGSGHSARLEDISQYTVDHHRQDLKEIIDLLGADQVTIIAHSWGTCLAINYLQAHPESVKRLVLSGPGPILPLNTALTSIRPPDSLNLRAPEVSNQDGNKKVYTWRTRIIDKWAMTFGAKLVSDQEVDDFFTLLNHELSKSTDCTVAEAQAIVSRGLGYYSHLMTVKSFASVEDGRDQLRSIEQPILLLRGQCDNQPWGYTAEYLDLFQNAELHILPDVGHDIAGKQPEVYRSMIEAFLDRTDAAL